MRESTIVLRGAVESGSGTGPRTGDLASEGYRRLAIVASVIGVVALVVMLVWLLESTVADFGRTPLDIGGAGVVVLVAALMVVGIRRGAFAPAAFVPVALATEVLVSIGLALPIFGWQHRVGADAIAWLRDGGAQPLALGAGEIPSLALWIILFATLIPMRPRQHLLGSLLSVAPLALLPFVSVWATGLPPALEPTGMGAPAHIAAWLSFRGLLAVGMAQAAARTVHGLRTRLAKAQRLGSYRLSEQIGSGGMGEVWRADHEMLARPAAVKLIRQDADAIGWGDVTGRFEQEVQATAQLRSPHTIEIYDYGLTDDGTFYYAMELLDGLDLEQLVKTHGPVPWERAVHILLQVCHSLGEAHDRGLVHRDIKPANIVLCRVGRDFDQVKVLDFGLVKARARPAGDPGLTVEGSFLGTPAYAAPELVTDAGGTDPRSDLYALGAVGFWLLTGRRVFEADGPVAMLVCHSRDEPPPPSSVSELEIPSEIDRAVLSCLAKSPDDRPPTVDAWASDLAALAVDHPWPAETAATWWEDRP